MLWLHRSAACCQVTLPGTHRLCRTTRQQLYHLTAALCCVCCVVAATHCRAQGHWWLRRRRCHISCLGTTSGTVISSSRQMVDYLASPAAPQQPVSTTTTTIDSSFLDQDSSMWTAQLHLVVLNYHLPNCVARLWPHGEQQCTHVGAACLLPTGPTPVVRFQLPSAVPAAALIVGKARKTFSNPTRNSNSFTTSSCAGCTHHVVISATPSAYAHLACCLQLSPGCVQMEAPTASTTSSLPCCHTWIPQQRAAATCQTSYEGTWTACALMCTSSTAAAGCCCRMCPRTRTQQT